MNLNITSVASGSVGIANGGYWGIGLKNNTTYKLSFWAKRDSKFNGTINAKLESNNGTVYAKSPDFTLSNNWQHFACDLTIKVLAKLPELVVL